MVTTSEIAWLAGLLEGEGAFAIYGNSPCLQMMSTDRDVVGKACAVTGAKLAGPYQPKRKPGTSGEPYQQVWAMRFGGGRAIGWMQTLYSFLGERRREKIKAIIGTWLLSPRRPNGPVWKEGRSRAMCHPDLVMRAKGMCNPCYMRARRTRIKETV